MHKVLKYLLPIVIGIIKHFFFFTKIFSHTLEIVTQRESQMTGAVLIICLFYLACVAPRIVYYILVFTGGFDSVGDFQHYLDYALNFLYWWHYTANFAIYAARSEQYRQAYIYFINEVLVYLYYKIFFSYTK